MVTAGQSGRERWPVSSQRGQRAPDAGAKARVENRNTGRREDGVVRLGDVVVRLECVSGSTPEGTATGTEVQRIAWR